MQGINSLLQTFNTKMLGAETISETVESNFKDILSTEIKRLQELFNKLPAQ